MEEKDLKMSVREFATMIIATILIFVFVGAGIGYVITYNQMKDDCPDRNLECPDIPEPDNEECEGIYMDENDEIDLDFNKTTGTLSFVYYDNHFEKLKGSPTFTPENWTDLGDWILDQHHDTFTQMQVNILSYIIANMAYYKETGTWLGE